MADEQTATEGTTAPESGSQPEEFSKPVGVNDSATFDKFFGKDSKYFDKEGKAKGSKEEVWNEKDKAPSSKATASSSSKQETTGKDTTKTTSKDSKEQKRASDKEGDAAKQPKETKAEAEDDAPAKAKDTYAKAKAATDRREGRKLYRQAMREAFGEVPDEFNDAKWGAARKKREEDNAAATKRETDFKANVDRAVTKLTPAINVLKRLDAAKLTDKLDGATVDKAITVMRALKQIEDGDFTVLGQLVADASGVDQEEAMKRFVRGVKASPEGRAARAAAEAAEAAQREAAEAKAQLAEFRAQLQREREQAASQQTQAQRDQERAAARASYLETIDAELEGHPVLKLPRGNERVLNYLVKTADPKTRAPRYTKEHVANLIVASERKRLAASRGVLDEPGQEPASGAPRVRALPRAETADVGVNDPDPMAAFGRIWDKNMATGGRRR